MNRATLIFVCATVPALLCGADLDLVKKSDVINLQKGKTPLRLIHARPDVEYLVNDSPKKTSAKPSTTNPCIDEYEKALTAAKSEADVTKAIEDAAKKCSDANNKKQLTDYADTRTSIPLDDVQLNPGETHVVTVKTADQTTPWSFTLQVKKPNEASLDLANPSAAAIVDPGTVQIQLFNAVPGKTYVVGPEGRRVEAPAITDEELKKTDCVGVVLNAVSKVKTESEVATKIADASRNEQCTDDAKKAFPQTIGQHTAVPLGAYTIEDGATKTLTVTRQGDVGSGPWTFSVRAASDKGLQADVHPKLDSLRQLTENHPSLITLRCSYTDEVCAGDAIYVNSDQISTVYITDLTPGGAMDVRIAAGEVFKEESSQGCNELAYNLRHYSEAPDRLIIPLYLTGGKGGIFGAGLPKVIDRAKALYGDVCTSDRRLTTPNADPVLPLVLRGKSTLLTIQVLRDNRVIKTLNVPIRYQRFWLDAGGFFVFSKVRDQRLERGDVPGDSSQTQVLARKNDQSIRPATGIVLNIHPGNMPIWGFQFGIATAENRLPSYYIGLAVRARCQRSPNFPPG